MFEILVEYRSLFLQGFGVTLELLGMIMLVGIPLGMLIGVVGGRFSKSVLIVVQGLKFFTKIVPVIVLLFWLHYPLQALLGVVINPFITTVVALGFVNLIATAYVVQTELGLLPHSYRDAGITLGMSKWNVIRHIELPIMFRRIAPTIILNQASMLEYTLLASLISVPELFRVSQTINSMIYDPVTIYSLLVLFFIVILAPLHLMVVYLERRSHVKYA